MFDMLTRDERLALARKLVGWLCAFGDVSHTLARVALANGEVDGILWDRREQYLDITHELQEFYAEARVA